MKISNYLVRGILKLYPFKKGRNYVLKFCLKHISGFEIDTDFSGNYFLMNLDNYIDAMMFMNGHYESSDIQRLVKLATEKKCSIFIDIGANIGVYTILVTKKLNISTYAFEPEPINYTSLMSNIYLNGLESRASIYNIALSDNVGKAPLYISTEPKVFDNNKHNSGSNSLIKNEERHDNYIEVEMKSLDKILSFTNHNILIKIDVEGYEYNVLKGMTHLLTTNNCLIQIEIFNKNFNKIKSLLSKYSYSLCEQNSANNYIFTKTANHNKL